MDNKEKLLEEFVDHALEIEELTKEISKLEAKLEELDKHIDKLESIDATNDELDVLSKCYNVTNRKRIELELRKNRLEKEMLLFELDATEAE